MKGCAFSDSADAIGRHPGHHHIFNIDIDMFRIGECFAYTALATRFGFNNVEVFDLRDTNIGDTEVQCFGRKEAVLELLVGGERGQKITDR